MDQAMIFLVLTIVCGHALAAIHHPHHRSLGDAPKPATEPPTILPNIRSSVVNGVASRFLVDRQRCLDIMKEKAPGLSLQLASDVERVGYDATTYSEIMVALMSVEDTTLGAQFGEDPANAPVSTEGMMLLVALPVVSARGEPVMLQLAAFTNETLPLMIPYYTNYQAVIRIDSITLESESDLVKVFTLLNGGDRMKLRVKRPAECPDDPSVGQDFDKAIGAHIRVTNYPETFDWGCDAYSFTFCNAMDAVNGENVKALIDGNVCTTMTTSKSVRCPASVTIVEITRGFLQAVPVQAGLESYKTEIVNREHSTGIVFPCMKKSKSRQMTLDEMWAQNKRNDDW